MQSSATFGQVYETKAHLKINKPKKIKCQNNNMKNIHTQTKLTIKNNNNP